jgi:hypothetical protein
MKDKIQQENNIANRDIIAGNKKSQTNIINIQLTFERMEKFMIEL